APQDPVDLGVVRVLRDQITRTTPRSTGRTTTGAGSPRWGRPKGGSGSAPGREAVARSRSARWNARPYRWPVGVGSMPAPLPERAAHAASQTAASQAAASQRT